MRVEMINSPDLRLPSSMLLTVSAILFMANVASSSDPCPSASEVHPCWCSDTPLHRENTTQTVWTTTTTAAATTATTPYYYSSITTTSAATDGITTTPYAPTTTTEEAAERKKRNHTKDKRHLHSYFARTGTSYYTVVTCDNISNTHDLEEAIGQGMKRRWMDKLVLSRIQPANEEALVRFPNAFLTNTRVKDLEIKDTMLSGDFIHYGNPLDGQNQSTISFTATNCSLVGQLTYSEVGTVNTMGLNKLLRLESIDFSWNYLDYIHDSAFRYLSKNVTKVCVSHNRIRGMGLRAFHYILKLRYVDLCHNRLEYIPRSVFPSPARHLRSINLSMNRLTTLAADFFSNMPDLETVDLSRNFLSSVPPTPWKPIWKQMHIIDVSGNPLFCDCNMMWLLPFLSNPAENGTSTPRHGPHHDQIILGSCACSHNDSTPHHNDSTPHHHDSYPHHGDSYPPHWDSYHHDQDSYWHHCDLANLTSSSFSSC